MDSDWERAVPFQYIDRATADRLFRRFDPGKQVETLEPLSGGLLNSNYRVTVKGSAQAFLLRLYAGEASGWRKEWPIFMLVKDHIPVPELYYVAHEPAVYPHPFAIFEFLDGVTLDQYENPPSHLAAEIGEALGWLHGQSPGRTGFLDEHLQVAEELPRPSTWASIFLREEPVARRLGPELFRAVTDLLERNHALLAQCDTPGVLAHGDFRPVNIMARDGKLQGIIDWEGCVAAPAVLDISLFTRFEEQVSGDFLRRFIRAYQRTAPVPLPDNWPQLARLMGLAILLQLLGPADERPRKYADVLRLIRKAVAEWPGLPVARA